MGRDARAPRRRGERAEQLAEDWLVARGYFPLARNHVAPGGEVDLVVGRDGLVVFVEVRRRARGAPVDALESVTPAKQRRVARAALDWLARTGSLERAVRFDVVAVVPGRRGAPPDVLHVEGAFETPADLP